MQKLETNVQQKDVQNENPSNSTADTFKTKQDVQKTTIVAAIFKGDLECFHEIFDWLSLKEIDAVAATCRRLQAIAGLYFTTYLSATEFELESG